MPILRLPCGFAAACTVFTLRTVVAERYLAGKLLDYNGDGATYMGWDLEMNAPVTIREFLPDSIAERREDLTLVPMAGCEITYRDCYQSFLELWRKLARMRGLSALILVFDIVEDHGTAYAISEYMEGVSCGSISCAAPPVISHGSRRGFCLCRCFPPWHIAQRGNYPPRYFSNDSDRWEEWENADYRL